MMEHLGLRERAALLLQMISAEAVEHWGDAIDPALYAVIDDLQGLLRTSAERALDHDLGFGALDAWVHSALAECRGRISKVAPALHQDLAHIAGGIAALGAGINCGTCAAEASCVSICTLTEPRACLERAQCADLLRGPAGEMLRYVDAWYRKTASLSGNVLPHAVVDIATEPINKEDEFGVGVRAETEYLESRDDLAVSRVILSFVINAKARPRVQFGSDGYFAIPYLLFHEFVCHVYCGLIAPGAKARGWKGHGLMKGLQEDPFVEGWMDYVAERLFTRWAEETGRRSTTYDERRASAMRDFRKARRGLVLEGVSARESALFNPRVRGDVGARSWERLLCDVVGSEVGADLFLLTSMHWNLLALSGVQAKNLVGLATTFDHIQLRAEAAARIVLKQFSSNDFSAMLHELLDL